MNLETIETKYDRGVFEVKGDFIDQNLYDIEKQFNLLIDTCEEIMISLWDVDYIDSEGLSLMTRVYERAMEQGKVLFFSGCKRIKVNTLFKKGKLYFVFKDDIN